MTLEPLCKIYARVAKQIFIETVSCDVSSINNKLFEMGIENTTGLTPDNSHRFKRALKTIHKKLREISLTYMAKDTETDETYILTKEEDYTVKNVLKHIRDVKSEKHNKMSM